VVLRGLSFAAHALAHVGFAGAAGAVLLGLSPLVGLLAFTLGGGIAMGLLGERLRGRDVSIGIVLAFTLGLGALFLSLNTRYATETFSILFGTILGVSRSDVLVTTALGALCLLGVAIFFRPLLFASLDPEVAQARGVRVRLLSVVFLLLVAVAVSVAVQVVGVLLIFTLLVAPPATACYLTARPLRALGLAAALALAETWVGIGATYAIDGTLNANWPVSFTISTGSVLAYLLARLLGPRLARGTLRRAPPPQVAVVEVAGGDETPVGPAPVA
jgi:zinc/manganese transport system permease protein